ncbi:hypothetical protein [Amycolatopsis sp.]|uniref:hypothetical protein n=1 Tax=Amycolatopsis sp. TaxID=37632 RepID=UPI00261FB257|nr:hypothetical protein [Amycolatopsis sp.]
MHPNGVDVSLDEIFARSDNVDYTLGQAEVPGGLTVDCDRCQVRGDACADCVVSVLLGAPPEIEWDDEECRAIDALAEAGMVPRLRLVSPGSGGRRSRVAQSPGKRSLAG